MDKRRRNFLIVFIVIVCLTALASYFIIQIKDNLDYLAKMPIQDVDLSTVEDGLYTGEYEVFPVSVIVQVEVEEHQIVYITILKHDNKEGEQAETIINDVLNEQSLDVDTVAGATYSSKVILLAIKDALD